HDRQSRPESIACSRVGVIRKGIEEETCKAMAGQVIFQIYTRGKEQPIRCNAPAFRVVPQIADGNRIVPQQPQHTSWDLIEQTHPDIKHRRCDLVTVVKRTENKPCLGQTSICPCWCMFADSPLGIVRLIGIREVCDFLSVKRMLIFRDNEAVGQNIIDIIDAHRTRISKKVDLNRSGAKRKNPGATTVRVPLQIQCNIDFQLLQEQRYITVAFTSNIDEMVE